MQSIIEELYYGNVLPFERRAPRGGEYARIIKYLSRNEEGLLETLTEAQKEIFEKFHDCWSEYASLAEEAIFAYAFKLGGRLMLETLSEQRKN